MANHAPHLHEHYQRTYQLNERIDLNIVDYTNYNVDTFYKSK